MSDANAIRRHAFFSGRVQGVGFRYTTADLARGFDVAGFVRNLPDGRVELVAEGTPDQVDAFVDAVRNEMRDCIERLDAADSPATGGFRDFRIAR
jgi:acylphosphatase